MISMTTQELLLRARGAKDAMADACFPGNPREATLDDVIELFKKICPAA